MKKNGSSNTQEGGPNRGWLNNRNPPGDWARAPRCRAKTCQQTDCRCPAMRNRARCRLHGGKSTGPRTPEGLERSRRANWKHGHYSREARAEEQTPELQTLYDRVLCHLL